MGPPDLTIALLAAANAAAPTPEGEPINTPATAVYLALGVSLLLFLALFILIAVNVVRRINRRRQTLERLHANPDKPRDHASPWATAGARAAPVHHDDLDLDTNDEDEPPTANAD